MKRKSLILIPSPNIAGGVSSYYQAIMPFVDQSIKFMVRGRRIKLKYLDKFFLILCYFFDFLVFPLKILNVKKIVINHSLGKEAIRRDAIFLRIAQSFGKEVIVFYRGLDPKVQNLIENGKYAIFNKTFLRVNSAIILSEKFGEKLLSWGFKGNIIIETTAVDNQLINYNFTHKNNSYLNILFLSRVEKYKGIFELLEAFELIQHQIPDVHLTIAGSGSALNTVKKIVKEKSLKNVHFPGHITGKEKARLYSESDLFILPSYAEGLPNAILEAMAFGLPIITTPVGGIPDIFTDTKNGFLLGSISSLEIYKKSIQLLSSKDLRVKIGTYNKENAGKYLASNVAKRFNSYFAC